MSIVSCNECGQKVSDQAKACPKCGAPRKVVKRTSLFTWIVGGIFAVGAIGGVISAANRDAPSAPTPKTPEQLAAIAKRDKQLNAVAGGAVVLKRAMKDPTTFELTSAVLMPSGTACYEYRAKNSFGAVLPSAALLTTAGKMLSKEQDGSAFVATWNKECAATSGEELAPTLKRMELV